MTEAPANTTVGVVGAGPAGLVLAHILRRESIPFVIVDRGGRSRSKSRGRWPSRDGALLHADVYLNRYVIRPRVRS